MRQRREDEGDGGGDQEKVRKGSEEHGPDILMHAMLVGGRHGVTKRARADIAAEKDVTTARSSGYFCRNEQQDQPAPSCDREGSTVEKAVGWQLFPGSEGTQRVTHVTYTPSGTPACSCTLTSPMKRLPRNTPGPEMPKQKKATYLRRKTKSHTRRTTDPALSLQPDPTLARERSECCGLRSSEW